MFNKFYYSGTKCCGATYLKKKIDTSLLVNQDPLENEFSILCQKCGYNSSPTVRKFMQNLCHRLQCALITPKNEV